MYKKRSYIIDLQTFRRKEDNCPMVTLKLHTPLGVITLFVEFYELFSRVLYARSRRKPDTVIIWQRVHGIDERVSTFDISPEFADMVINSLLNLRLQFSKEDEVTRKVTDFDIDDAFDNLLTL